MTTGVIKYSDLTQDQSQHVQQIIRDLKFHKAYLREVLLEHLKNGSCILEQANHLDNATSTLIKLSLIFDIDSVETPREYYVNRQRTLRLKNPVVEE